MADQSAKDLVVCYLQDAIAAETAFESQLLTFSREGDDSDVQLAFANHAEETSTQRKRLTARLEELGGSKSGGKSLLSHILSFGPENGSGHTYTRRTPGAKSFVCLLS